MGCRSLLYCTDVLKSSIQGCLAFTFCVSSSSNGEQANVFGLGNQDPECRVSSISC